MNYRIVSDSSSDMLSFPGIDFRSVPLRIITAKHEYVDNAELDVEKMVGEIRDSVTEYQKHTHLLFSLESLTNLARNGRVSPAVAKIAGVLGIRVMGEAREGVLDLLHKIRGKAKTLDMIFAEMKKRGFSGGKVVIDHCFNQNAANLLAEKILSEFPSCDLKIGRNGALCSFYAERGGVLIGFEDSL